MVEARDTSKPVSPPYIHIAAWSPSLLQKTNWINTIKAGIQRWISEEGVLLPVIWERDASGLQVDQEHKSLEMPPKVPSKVS